VSFRRTRVSGVGLTNLVSLKDLESVSIGAASDAGLKELARFRKLTRLGLGLSPGITRAGLAILTRLQALQSMSLAAPTSDGQLLLFPPLPALRVLYVATTSITDAGVKHLSFARNIEILSLSRTRITDAALAELKGFDKLETLFLVETAITDKGLKHLKDLTNLRCLFISATKVTDAGLEHLEKIKRLGVVSLRQTRTTPKGEMKLKKALPSLVISR
jgi:hypothetical protein